MKDRLGIWLFRSRSGERKNVREGAGILSSGILENVSIIGLKGIFVNPSYDVLEPFLFIFFCVFPFFSFPPFNMLSTVPVKNALEEQTFAHVAERLEGSWVTGDLAKSWQDERG